MSFSSSTANLTKTKILEKANDLLIICSTQNQLSSSLVNNSSVSNLIKTIDDLKSTFYIHIFESICNIELEDKRIPSRSYDDEIHNVQKLIDTLAVEILQEDLSHLSTDLICNGDLASIEYLLDILRCISEWISSRLESLNSKSNSSQHDKTGASLSKRKRDYVDWVNTEEEITSNNDIWLQHLEHLDVFEELHQELETTYRSESDINSVNTSAFSYRPSKKIVTFNAQEQIKTQLKEPINQFNKKNDKENTYTKSFITSSNEKNSGKPKGRLNPVQLFHKYKKQWEQQKAPGEKDHARLRWYIRSKMNEKPAFNQRPLSEMQRQEWID